MMTMNGLWTAEFGSNLGMFGGGVVILSNDRVLGGDNSYYYEGNCVITGNKLSATLQIVPFILGQSSVFGTVSRKFTLKLEGTAQGDLITAQGTLDFAPNLSLAVKLKKRL
jgi:T3SS negative regulator,GrlR